MSRRVDAEGICADQGIDSDGNTLLHKACEVGNISIVFYLHEKYPSMDYSALNSSGMQPLHMACSKGMLHVVMYLVNNNLSDPTACTSDGRSTLHIAAAVDASAVVAFLLTVLPEDMLRMTESRGGCTLSLLHKF